jgi:hypothetical protein
MQSEGAERKRVAEQRGGERGEERRRRNQTERTFLRPEVSCR